MSEVIQSVVTRERSLAKTVPKSHNEIGHTYITVYLANGEGKTVEYGQFDSDPEPDVRIRDGALAFHVMVEAREFETEGPKAYEWSKFKHWVMHESGYNNSPVSATHNAATFAKACVDHLIANTARPSSISELAENAEIELHDPTPEAEAVFNAVKGEVIAKFHELQKMDDIHNTHIFDQAENLSAYRLVQFGKREVEYGTIFVGKIDIGHGNYLHVRAHKYHEGADKDYEFHSIRMTRDCGVWSNKAKLVYFEA